VGSLTSYLTPVGTHVGSLTSHLTPVGTHVGSLTSLLAGSNVGDL